MKLTIRVDFGQGPTEVTVSPYAVIGWEKEQRTKISKLASDGIGFSELAELAWRQLELENRYTGDLDSFERKLLVIEPVATDPS